MITRQPFWLPKNRKRKVKPMAMKHSYHERVEAAHGRMDKLRAVVAALPMVKPDDGAKPCRKCGKPVHSNDLDCVCCIERERNSKT